MSSLEFWVNLFWFFSWMNSVRYSNSVTSSTPTFPCTTIWLLTLRSLARSATVGDICGEEFEGDYDAVIVWCFLVWTSGNFVRGASAFCFGCLGSRLSLSSYGWFVQAGLLSFYWAPLGEIDAQYSSYYSTDRFSIDWIVWLMPTRYLGLDIANNWLLLKSTSVWLKVPDWYLLRLL